MDLKVNYAEHPAFRDLINPAKRNLPAAAAYFAAVDNLWATLVGPEFAGRPEAATEKFAAEHGRLFGTLRAELAAAVDADYLPYVLRGFENSTAAIAREIACIVTARASNRHYSPAAAKIGEELEHSAIAAFKMAPSERAKLVACLKPQMDALREQRRTNSGARCYVTSPGYRDDWFLIKKFLRQNKIEEGISAFTGLTLELVGYSLTYSHPDETWFKICYSDIGLEVPQTVQMHLDEDNVSAKSMFYLNDIDADSGAFSYVPKTASLLGSRTQQSFFKQLDFASNDFAVAKNVPKTIYNRVMFKTPELRPYFAHLPQELQGSATPGDDLLAGEPLMNYLVENERCITSEQGDLALFAGGEILHRGGLVRQGERWALQMIYKEPFSVREKVMAHAGAVVRKLKAALVPA